MDKISTKIKGKTKGVVPQIGEALHEREARNRKEAKQQGRR